MRFLLVNLFCLILTTALTSTAAILGNNMATWSFDNQTGNLTSVARAGSHDTLSLNVSWNLVLKDDNGNFHALTPKQIKPVLARNNNTLTATWNSIVHPQTNSTLDIVLTVSLQQDGSTEWRISINGTSNAMLWEVHVPALENIDAKNSLLALPVQDGCALTGTIDDFELALEYPATASMQFMAVKSGGEGLAFFAKDGELSRKFLTTSAKQGKLSLAMAQLPKYSPEEWTAKGRRTVKYISSYPVVLAPFSGDILNAASAYRAWARPNAKSAPCPIATSAWTATTSDPQNALRQWFSAIRLTNAPILALMHGHTMASHGHLIPEITPADGYLRDVLQDTKHSGITPAPCSPTRKWDTRSTSWHKTKAQSAGALFPSGDLAIVKDNVSNIPYAILCTNSSVWLDKLKTNARRILQELDAPAIVLEHILDTPVACYNPKHGHPIHGGNQMVKDAISAINAIRVQNKHIVCQGVHEALLGYVDAFASDNARMPSGATAIPLFNSVYNGLAQVATMSADAAGDDESYINALAIDVTLGRFPGIKNVKTEIGQDDKVKQDFTRKLLAAYATIAPAIQQANARLAVIQNAKASADADCTVISTEKLHVSGYTLANGNAMVIIVNSNKTPATLELVPGKSLANMTPSSISPKSTAATSLKSLEIPPMDCLVIGFGYGETTQNAAPLPQSFLAYPLENQYFPFYNSENADELWACNDAFVARNPKKMHGMLTISSMFKSLSIRKGSSYLLPKLDMADGAMIPNEMEFQSCAVLYKLPFKLSSKHNVFVISGSDKYVCLNGPFAKDITMSTPETGVFAARIITKSTKPDGTVRFFKNLKELQQAFKDDDTEYIVSIAYAAMDKNTLDDAVERCSKSGIDSKHLADAWNKMAKEPTLENLALLNKTTKAWYQSANKVPTLFSPNSPATELLKHTQALVLCASYSPNKMQSSKIALKHDYIVANAYHFITVANTQKNNVDVLKATDLIPLGISEPVKFTATVVTDDDIEDAPAFSIMLENPPEDMTSLVLSAWTSFKVGDVELQSADLAWLDVVQPFSVITKPSAYYVSPGCTSEVSAAVINPTESPVTIKTSASKVDGWQVLVEPQIATIEPRTPHYQRFIVTPPAGCNDGLFQLPVKIDGEATKSKTDANLRLDVVRHVKPVKNHTVTGEQKPTTVVKSTLLALFPKKGERFAVKIASRAVKEASWQLLNPSFEVARQGALPAKDSVSFGVTAGRDAPFYLNITTNNNNPIDVSSTTHALAQRSSSSNPIVLPCRDTTLFFFVPQQAKAFQALVSNCESNAHITIVSPTGRTIRLTPGDSPRLTVMPDEAGKPWTLKANNAKNATFGLKGDVSPWLSASPDAVFDYSR